MSPQKLVGQRARAHEQHLGLTWFSWSSSTSFSSRVPSVALSSAFRCFDRTFVADFTDFVPGETSHTKPILLSRSYMYALCEGYMYDWCKCQCNENFIAVVRIQNYCHENITAVVRIQKTTHHLIRWQYVGRFACLAFSEELSLLLHPNSETIILFAGYDTMAVLFFEFNELIVLGGQRQGGQTGEGHTHNTHKNICKCISSERTMSKMEAIRWQGFVGSDGNMSSAKIKRTHIIHLRSFLSALAAAVVPVGSSPTDPLRTRLNIPLGSQSKSKFVKRSY